ncbi:hypothetical protein HN51_014980 [Arachis hypogaea]|uniref:cysteine-tryptophan domain-containing zinc finger protein 3-like n=1 Tax=Arachis hypogaea TaxID=3818 RepID=UPI000DED0482|nr:uncharacterized protein LOC112695826 isoform X1 [Arachis hypogaea]XP_025604105.1 uncharacterized protein LOC112695826 isoform X1 [Arachis hypogaea]QHO44967.1 uncharacterized protein DS421_6g175160 [Arachis hypogaea]
MISAGGRDARKGLGLGLELGLGAGRREMVESELEEGEACSYQNHEDYDATVDPDVALSYIDEKIQDVLGHFQKDFEGGVSAENLGAKFGGYGSFLPTHHRSPVWSHPRTPQKVHSQNTPRSPNIVQLESGQGDSVQFSTGAQSSRFGPGSATSSRLPAVKAPSVDDVTNQEKCISIIGAEALTSKCDSLNMNATSIADQKVLKVRIKMGPGNLTTRKNAAIYSGLGLDMSPTSSLDDSPSESEGISRGPQDAPFESPTSILQVMTVLPMLLSPLPNDLIELTENEVHTRDGIRRTFLMDGPEGSGMLLHESYMAKGDRKLSGGKKVKSLEGHESSVEVKGSNKKNTRNDLGALSTKEQGRNALNTEELVSQTLKLPLLSRDDLVKDVDGPCNSLNETKKGIMREKTASDLAEKEWVEPTLDGVNGFAERAKGGAGRKFVGGKVSEDNSSFYAPKDIPLGDKICDSGITESNVSKVTTASSTEFTEPPKKAYQRNSLREQDSITLPVVKEHPFPVGKKKSKGSNSTVAIEKEKENLKTGSPLVTKLKKSSEDSSASKSETEDVRVQKGLLKHRDTYKDFFGELEEEDRMDSTESPKEAKLKDSEVAQRSMSTINCGAKERSADKKVDKPLTAEVYPKMATNIWYTGNGHGTDAENENVKGVSVMMAPVDTEDHWVLCDRCHKWRLLPVGTNPDSLPEKWLCSMLDWLPDMNRCSFTEDETTKAVIALYQVPPPDGKSNLQNVSGSVMVGGTVATVQHPDQHQPNNDLNGMPVGKKKVVKDSSNYENKDGFSQLSSSIKKNLPSSVRSRSLNEVHKSPVVSEADVPGEKHKNKQKLENNSDGGDTKNMKMKSRRDPDQDCSRPTKKVKTDKIRSTDEEWIAGQSGTTRKASHGSNSSFPTTSVGKDRSKQKDRSSSRDSKSEKDRLQISAENTRDRGHGFLDEASLDLGNCDAVDSVKKRKLKEYQDAQTCSTGNPHLQGSRFSAQEFSDSRKEKKTRNSKSEGRESSSSKGSVRTDKRVGHMKNHKFRQNPGSSHVSLDVMDSLKRDVGSAQASVATTSSSSKVSGSHKTKASLQEVKGSPVESVSSSPMRVLYTDKFPTREAAGKDESHDTAVVDSPRRFSDAEEGGSDRSGAARKDKSFTMVHKSDFQNKGVNHTSVAKPKAQITGHHTNSGVGTVSQDGTYPIKEQIKNQCEDRTDTYCANVSRILKNNAESDVKGNKESCKSENPAETVKNTSTPIQPLDKSPLSEAKQNDGKVKSQERSGFKPDQSENIHAGKKDLSGKSESSKKESHFNKGLDFQEVGTDAVNKKEALNTPSQLPDCHAETSSKRPLSERTDKEVIGKGKSLSLLPSGGAQVEPSSNCPRPVVGFLKGNGDVKVEPSKVDDASKLPKKQIKKSDNQNGTQQIGSRNPVPNGHRSKELDAPTPIRRDTHAATNALKEAKDLKHLADRLKNAGSTLEGTSLYFQAALKFLLGASLLESGNNEHAKHSDVIQSLQIYSSTAKLCEFCAHEYEKSKDMASAALAYKCMEVAYMRVIYSSHSSASRDRHELQTALQMVPLGESPSSSASDVDNVNNTTAADKVALSKSVNSPQVAGNHVIAARNRPNFVRLLNFAQDVNFAMEASRKSWNAFAAANSSPGMDKKAGGICSIKKALDFSFQDVEGLLRLVRIAVEANNR